MGLPEIIGHCVTLTGGVPGIGIIRDHEMFVKSREAVVEHFTVGGVINCVEIDRARSPAERMAAKRTKRNHVIHFHFYYGSFEDNDTRPTFRAIVEATELVFRNEFRFPGVSALAGPFSIEFDGFIDKAGMLLHYAQGALEVQEDVT